MIGSNMKRVIALIAASAAAVSLAACGSNSSQDSKTIEFWDPYPQKNDSSTWAKYVTNCAPEGYNVKRIGYAQSDLLNNLTTAVKAGNAPQIALIDNPKMPTAVDAGLVTDIEAAGVDVSGFDKNIEGPGIIDGVQYGVSYGTNALGLYYNPDVLNKAGVDPESITDWDSLNSAIEKVVNAGYKGITFSGISGEEGTFQFLPWFWGAGGQLKDASGSSAEQDALDLVSGWVQKGWAPKSGRNGQPICCMGSVPWRRLRLLRKWFMADGVGRRERLQDDFHPSQRWRSSPGSKRWRVHYHSSPENQRQ